MRTLAGVHASVSSRFSHERSLSNLIRSRGLARLDRREQMPDAELTATVADAGRWADELLSGSTASVGAIERREGESEGDQGGRKGLVSRIRPLAFLAPDIWEAILNAGRPDDPTAGALRRPPDLPLDWSEQPRVLGFEPRPN